MSTSFLDWTTTESEAVAYQQLSTAMNLTRPTTGEQYQRFEYSSTRASMETNSWTTDVSDMSATAAGSSGTWVTGIPNKTLITSTRLPNGTVICDGDSIWSATDNAGNRVSLDRNTSEVTIDRRVVKGLFVDFVEKRSLNSYLFSPGSRDDQEAVDALLWLLLKCR